jgi:hypothetical protein
MSEFPGWKHPIVGDRRDVAEVTTPGAEMPNPDQAMLDSPEFEAIWQAIKRWDINAPEYYRGYCGANGSHVAVILNALAAANIRLEQHDRVLSEEEERTRRLRRYSLPPDEPQP